MSDEELIAQLRSMHWCVTTLDNGVGVSNSTVAADAADRIEALTEQLAAAQQDADEAEAYAEEVEADRKKTYEALLKVTRIHGEVETKLAKAVKLLELAVELAQWNLNPKLRDDMVDFTTTVKGEKDE